MLRAPRTSLFPYTTLFRSVEVELRARGGVLGRRAQHLRRIERRAIEAAAAREIEEVVDEPLQPHRGADDAIGLRARARSEEHTSELQSHVNLVCRLLPAQK